ncbi:MAG: putative glycolipid-binding domain-containing protein, partial [Dongiaceae bacterium]
MELDRTVCWTPVGGAGFEHLQLRAEDGGCVARSIVLGIDDETPFRLHYKIKTDHDWRTRKVWVRAATPFGESAQTLRSDGRGNWRNEDGTELPALRDCIDVDITVTPFTNTLPINRLRLTPGQSVDIRVVYLTAPGLDISVSAQRYSRRGQESDIFFESPAHDFTALLPIDGDGLVMNYPQLFARAYP